MKNRIDQIIIFVFCLLLCCSSVVLAESKVVTDSSVSSLAGFKVHTVILQSEPAAKHSAPVPASSVSTNNELVKKNSYGSRVTDNNSSNVVSTSSNFVKNSENRRKTVYANHAVKTVLQPTRSENPQNKAAKVNNTSPKQAQFTSNEKGKIEKQVDSRLTGVKHDKTADSSDRVLPESITGDAKQIKEPGFFTLAGSLIVVILLVFMFAWVYNKLRGINTVALLSGKLKKAYGFNLLSTTSLGQGKSIHLVEIKGKQLVIGSTANNINLLTEFNHDNAGKSGENISEITGITEESDEQNNEISDVYKEYLEKNE